MPNSQHTNMVDRGNIAKECTDTMETRSALSGGMIGQKLALFREQIEVITETPCHEIITSLGLVLYDICRSLGFDEEQTRLVIGSAAHQAICDQPTLCALAKDIHIAEHAR